LTEQSIAAYEQISGVAEACRRGDIHPSDGGWFAHRHEYYVESTIYRLVAPMATFRLLQRSVTAFDLRLDSLIGKQYATGRLLARSMSSDYLTARSAGLQYDRNRKGSDDEWRRRREEAPEIAMRQGLSEGRMENAIRSLTVDETGKILPFGTFSELYRDPTSELYRHFDALAEMFQGFHPARRPVLWLILMRQICTMRVLMELGDQWTPRDVLLAKQLNDVSTMPLNERRIFDWRTSRDDADDDIVLARPFDLAEEHLRERLARPFLSESTHAIQA
jgi:hypothetical protein